MYFKDRAEAGRLLAYKLKKYEGKNVVVYALPRGGVITALEIAKYLNAPLDLIITRKIGHPYNPEYAIAATAENGHIVGTERELKSVDEEWLKEEIERQRFEAKRRREKYLQGKAEVPVEGKIAILVDDGIATGLTMRVGIMELKHRHPKKIVVAVPIVPKTTAARLKDEAEELVSLDIPSDDAFLGAVGAYYGEFSPVEDEEVIAVLKAYEKKQKKTAIEQGISYATQAMTDPTLLTFSSHEYMVDKLKEIPNLTPGKFDLERFSNEELHIKLHSHAAERDCIVLGSITPPDTNLFAFLLLVHTLKKENAHRITAVLPYLAYSRHDKKEPQKSYATALIGDLLQASGVDEVITVDVHSPHVRQLFPIPLISLSPAKIFASEIKKQNLEKATIVAPDEGARRRANAVAKEAGITGEIAYVIKERTADGVKLVRLHGNVGKKVVIIDDILDTGKTLIACCEKLIEKNVSEITIMVTHGLFTGNEWKKLWELGVKHIYCTDSVPLPKQIASKNITVLSIIPILIEELREENKGIFTVDASQRYSFYDYDEP